MPGKPKKTTTEKSPETGRAVKAPKTYPPKKSK